MLLATRTRPSRPIGRDGRVRAYLCSQLTLVGCRYGIKSEVRFGNKVRYGHKGLGL